jgi:hypothetical protein
MKTRVLILAVLLAVVGLSDLSGQGFQPPANGKAVIYFVSGHKKNIPFEFFHYDQFIGELEKLNYMRYELSPGKQLLWASSEKKEFLDADLKEGGSYIVMVTMVSGFWRVNPKFTPITDTSHFFLQAATLIKEKAPYNIPEAEIKERQAKLGEFIANILNLYETEFKTTQEIKVIKPEMALSEEAMK